MTFNVEEKHALGGSIAAMAVPTLADMVGMDRLIVSFADAVFEGDRGSASFVSAVGFSAIGAGMILAAILGPFDDFLGIMMTGLGAGFIGIGLEAFNEGGN